MHALVQTDLLDYELDHHIHYADGEGSVVHVGIPVAVQVVPVCAVVLPVGEFKILDCAPKALVLGETVAVHDSMSISYRLLKVCYG